MNTIGAAIKRGEIEVDTITWEELHDIDLSVMPCPNCEFLRMEEDNHAVCSLFDDRYNSVEPEPAAPMSSASLLSVIVKCSLKKEIAVCPL